MVAMTGPSTSPLLEARHPCISSGSTDSKYLRGLGIPCYGIDMVTINLDIDMKKSVHGRNEKVDIDSLQLKSDFLTELARKYLGE